jgi:Carboxypeptidase regulatory-like domain
MNSARTGLFAVLAAMIACITVVHAGDAILSGSVTSATGEKLGGVTVSAKPAGGTITTTVFTDEAGDYFFPPLPAGKYQVWAQAVTFKTAKADLELPAAPKHSFVLDPLKDFVRQLPGSVMLSALPEETDQDKRMKRLVRNDCTGCHTASFMLQHRFDEAGWSAIIELMKNANVYGTFVGKERKPSGILDYHQKELAAYLARARPGRKRRAVQARAAAGRRGGARDVQGIRRPA